MNPQADDLGGALRDLVSGNIDALAKLRRSSQSELVDAGRHVRLVVRAEDVARVLRGMQSGRLSDEKAQAWAAFIRNGAITPAIGPPQAEVEIDYDEVMEEPIVEALMRLDELGDLIDGEISAGENVRLRRALGDFEPCPGDDVTNR